MPFILVIAGLLLIVSAVRGTEGQLWNLIYGDVTGLGAQHGFLTWLAAILAIGFLGYYGPLQTPSRLLLGLVVLGIFISNQGVLSQISAEFSGQTPLPQGGAAPADPTAAALPAEIPVHVTGMSGGSGGGGGPLDAVKSVASVATLFA